MELFKIDELVNDGKVLYHRYIRDGAGGVAERKDEERRLEPEKDTGIECEEEGGYDEDKADKDLNRGRLRSC